MRSGWIAAALALLLGGCEMALVSKKPLFDQGKVTLKPGLWAIMPDGCSVPGDAELFDWPACAKPARVRDRELTIFSSSGPVRLDLVASDGMPVILQISADEARIKAGASDLYGSGQMDMPPPKSGNDKQDPLYSYLGFLPDPGNPVTKGMLMPLYCPRDANADLRDIKKPPENAKEDSQQCEVTSAKAVRRIAQQTASDWPKWRAIWIADKPYAPSGGDDAVTNVSDN